MIESILNKICSRIEFPFAEAAADAFAWTPFSTSGFNPNGFILFNSLAVILVVILAVYFLKKENISGSAAFFLISLGVFSAALGARLFKVILTFFAEFPGVLDCLPCFFSRIPGMGSTVTGAIIALILFYFLYVRRRFGEKADSVIDAAILAVPLGQAVGRIGCFLEGCCYGRPLSGSVLHPVQLYESALNILNFLWLLRIYRKRKFPGQVFARYLVHYGVIRFLLEYLRGDVVFLFGGPHTLLSLTRFQLAALSFIAVGIIIHFPGNKRSNF